MKKTISIIITMLLIVSLIPNGIVHGASMGTGKIDNFSYTINNGEAIITSYWGSGDVIIPDTIDGCPVTTIETRAFQYGDNLKSITIPDTVRSIEQGAFGYGGCGSILNFYVALGNTHFSSIDGVLLSKDKSELIVYPAGREKADIPNGVKKINSSAFEYSDKIIEINIPITVEDINIDYNSFSSFHRLENINVDEGNLFYSSYNGVLFNKDKTSIIKYPQSKSDISFSIPSSVTRIEDNAFHYCKLEHLQIPEGVTYIGERAFWNCYNLKELKLPNNLLEIGDQAFYQCQIGSYLTIPASVEKIGDFGTFGECYDLENIYVDDKNENYTSIDGVLFSKDKTKLICCPYKRTGIYMVPKGVEQIYTGAFGTSIISLSLPISVTYIGFEAARSVNHVFFEGTEEQWKELISPSWANFALSNAPIHYEMYGSDDIWDISTHVVSCTENGYTSYSCTLCGEEYKTNIEYSHHTKGSIVQVIDPTCEDCGYTIYLCSVCGQTFQEDWTDALGGIHDGTALEKVLPTCTEKGYTKYHCNICGGDYKDDYVPSEGHTFENDVCIKCGRKQVDCIGSSHPYEPNCDDTWTIYRKNAQRITLTFSSQTYVEDYWDYIYIYDGSNNLLGEYTGYDLSSKKISVEGDTVLIRLKSDEIECAYGFEITDIEADISLCNQSVLVEGTNKNFDQDIDLHVEKKDVSDLNLEKSCFINSATVVYDIYLENETEIVQPKGNIKVSIPVPNTMDAEKCHVFYIDTYGDIFDMDAIYENGYMVFETDHFSYYALVELNNQVLKGTITSYSSETDLVSMRLLKGTKEIDSIQTVNSTYSFESIPAGEYTLEVSKDNHVSRTYEVKVTDTDVAQNVKICLFGDVNGDGKVNTIDVNRVYAHVRGTNPLTDYELECANVAGTDTAVNTIDVNRIYAHVKGTNLLW